MRPGWIECSKHSILSGAGVLEDQLPILVAQRREVDYKRQLAWKCYHHRKVCLTHWDSHRNWLVFDLVVGALEHAVNLFGCFPVLFVPDSGQ